MLTIKALRIRNNLQALKPYQPSWTRFVAVSSQCHILLDWSTIISSLKCAKYQIFGIFDTPITKTIPHQLFQISKNLRHGYSTVSNMRRYRHQCQTLFGLFNSFFLSPRIRCISRSLSILISRSLCLAFSPRLLAIADLATPILPRQETKTAQAHH